ncbi:MAG TPA: sensor histidine kinase, partial [Leptospiraceae bacterium]|nr:sensor histidine kinase [Leptospiraceae bacterium]
GGFLYSIYFGTETGLLKYANNIRNRDSFILGILFFVMLYHIGLYLIRRKETLSIYFMLVVLCVFLRTASTGEKLIVDIFSVNYSVYVALEYITFFMVMPLSINLIVLMFSIQIHKFTIPVLFFKSILLSFITIFTDANFYSNIVSFYLPIFILEFIFAYYLVIQSVFQKKENSMLIFLGVSIMILFTINDILNTLEFIHTSYIAHYGLISVVFCKSLYLLLRFVKAFKENESLTIELTKANERLEEKITERTKEIMEEKIIAIKANELKDKFISLLSHDLRSPMGNAKMLITSAIEADDASEKDLSRNYLDLASKSIANAVEMTEKILQFSQTKSGQIELNIQNCYPSRIADKIFNMMLSKIREKKIQLLNFIPEEEKIETDEALLQEVLFNLISNSIKFSKPGDLISIRSEMNQSAYRILVKDTGIGIPEEIRANLFSRSIKTTTIGTAGEVGTGLGLPLCKDIVKLLRGDIFLSDAVSDGTEFTIHLPIYFPNDSKENRYLI